MNMTVSRGVDRGSCVDRLLFFCCSFFRRYIPGALQADWFSGNHKVGWTFHWTFAVVTLYVLD